MAEVRVEILHHVGVIGEGTKGWKKELNLVSWNGRDPKLDVRDWNEDHTHMGKGITLDPEEAKKLAKLLTEATKKSKDATTGKAKPKTKKTK